VSKNLGVELILRGLVSKNLASKSLNVATQKLAKYQERGCEIWHTKCRFSGSDFFNQGFLLPTWQEMKKRSLKNL